MCNKRDSLGDQSGEVEPFLSDKQRDVLYGALLGDGCLIKHKRGTNAIFSYLSKSKQHVEFVAGYFKEYWKDKEITQGSYFDNRTNKVYTNNRLKTYSHKIFTEEYTRWYQNGTKHIPEDLKLTPMVCLIWYIGDGCICNLNRTQSIKLATQCFTKEEQERILVPQLQDFEAKLMKADISKDGEQQYFIYIPKRKMQKFLEYIGPCPFSDYQYKWDYKEYKNFCLSQHPEFMQKMITYFNSGMSANTIARLLEVDRSTVVKYLIQNGLNPKDNLYKKRKVDNDNEE